MLSATTCLVSHPFVNPMRHGDEPNTLDVNVADDSLPLEVESIWRAIEGEAKPMADPRLGADVGGVTLVRLIAEGGMGRVYEGKQHKPRRPVAVKVLRPGLVSRELLRRFLNESAILGRLRHPGITQVHAAGSCNVAGAMVPFFIMELVAGARPITDYCHRHGLSPTDIVSLFRQACDAVAEAHRLGIVHRDLTPGNMLVDAGGYPRIIDFGIARHDAGSDCTTMLTDHGRLIGTLQYMSPEQCSGTTTVNVRSDVYSLGMLLYELLAGDPPYDLRNRSVANAAREIIDISPAPLRSRAPVIPRRIARVVDRCLAKDPARRYPDAGHLSAALAEAMDSSSVFLDWLPIIPRSVPRRGRHIAIGILSGVLFGLLGLLVVRSVQDWTLMERTWGAMRSTVTPSQIKPAPWHVVASDGPRRFVTGFRNVFQDGSDEFLVSKEGMRRWEETSRSPSCTYWAPADNDVPGTLVYRFSFEAPARRIHLQAESNCWDFASIQQATGQGRGASSIEVSKDGDTWVMIRNNLEPRRWGASWLLDEDLPDTVCGSDCLWVRLRLVATEVPADADYMVAQFGRSSAAATTEVFSVVAELDADVP